MKILFDTNVLVSAFMTGGSCYDIIDHSVHEHDLYYTAFVMDEFRRVFKDNFRFSKPLIEEFISFINRFFIKGDTSDTVENVCKDPNDNQVLADAVINDIDAIVTGDKDLLDLKNYKGIKIISPKEYWIL